MILHLSRFPRVLDDRWCNYKGRFELPVGCLRLENNQISDITPLAGLTKLFRLWINGNKVSDITPLSSLTELKILGLEPNPLNDEARNVYIPALQKRGIHFELFEPKP